MHCNNCGYDITGGMITADNQAVCPSCFALGGHRVTEAQEFGWYGAGFAVYKSSGAIPGWLPPVDDRAAWSEFVDGFGAAHAVDLDYDEAEAILSGQVETLETTEDALLRILKFPIWEQIKGLV